MARSSAVKRGAKAVTSPANGTSKKRKATADECNAVDEKKASALRVHRCRFIDWMPQAIHTICFNPAGTEIAVARANGDLEVWNIEPKWHLKYVISGSEGSKISALAWSQSNRLFVASLDGTLWEIDFEFLRRTRVVDSNGGPIWCMTLNESTESLAIGCEDGRIRVFSFQNDDLFFVKGFVSTGRRVVSIAWHAGSNRLFSGSEDGLIHCWNGNSGRNESRITLETLARQTSVVWSLLVLDDLTIVSGDSQGHISFWNGHTGTLMQKFSHLTADVLTLCVDQACKVLFASGVDNQVVQFRRNHDQETQWTYSYSHHAHSHDVRALALSQTANPILVSGGIDTQLVWYRADSFNIHRPSKVASMPYPKTVSLCHEKRLLLVQKSTSLDLWRLNTSTDSTSESEEKHKLIVELQSSGSSSIMSSAIARNGAHVAFSTSREVKLFSLNEALGFLPRKVALPGIAKSAARTMLFTPDSSRLIMAQDSHSICVLDVKKMEVLKVFELSTERGSAQPIISLDVSLDGQWLAIGDLSNTICIYNLDSMQFYCTLPRPSEMHTSLGFNPSGKVLVATLVSNSFVCYDVEKRGLSDWYRQHHEQFPESLVHGRNIKGVAFDSAHPDILYLYSQSSLYRIDMSEGHSGSSSSDAMIARKTRRSRRPSTASESDTRTATEDDVDEGSSLCKLIQRYRPLAYVDFVAENELVVVETPWLNVLARLPGALHRHKYGK